MLESSSLVEKRMGERDYIFLKYMHYVESDCAALFSNIVTNVDILSLFDIDGEIKRLEKQFGVTLAAAQNEAVKRRRDGRSSDRYRRPRNRKNHHFEIRY